MIAYLRGKIISKNLNSMIIDVSGVGYQVFSGEKFLNELGLGQEVEVYTHHQVREDASDLYGFKSPEDLELFVLLLSVSGVGPKSALGVLQMATSDEVKEAIIRGDAGLLTKVAGIGQKTAERIVLELKTKVLRSAKGTGLIDSLPVSGSDEIDALMSLGYSLSEARSALNLVSPELIDSGERVKAALKKMARN